MSRRWIAGLCLSFAGFDDAPLRAQETPAPDTTTPDTTAPVTDTADGGRITTWPPAFFAEFQPTNALDMILRIPGFTYERGDSGQRGLSGASGNILIDGQRPSTKSLALDDILRRIAVEDVTRIEVIRGSAPGVDMQGRPIVANIIRRAGGTSSAAVELMTKFYGDHAPARIARIEGSRSRGALSLEGAIQYRDEKDQGASGTGQLMRRDRNGVPTSFGQFEAAWDRRLLAGNGAAEYRTGPNFFRLSLSGELSHEDRRDISMLSDTAGTRFDERVITGFQSNEFAASLDYERAFGNALTLRLLALESREHDKSSSTSTGLSPAQVSTEDALAGESIVRAAATWLPAETLTLDGSVERAFNFLDAENTLERGGVPVVLPSANVRVEERRVEAQMSARWQAWAAGTLEANLAYETSTIAQQGDADSSLTLRYWKPRLNATIAPFKDWEVRLRAERTVSQLDFEDYASTASLDTGTVNAGNPDLVPEQAWVFEAAIEHHFWSRGALTLTASHAAISNAIDLVPIGGRFDAPGNIGSGTRQEAKASLTLPLDRLGAPGTLIRFNGALRWSRVTDPVTLATRRISNQRPTGGDVSLIKELPALKSVFTADFFFGWKERSYRINEIRTESSSNDPLAKIYWDWTPRPGTSLRLQVENIAFRQRSRDRIRFDGPRGAGQVSGFEQRTAVLDPFFMMRLRKSF